MAQRIAMSVIAIAFVLFVISTSHVDSLREWPYPYPCPESCRCQWREVRCENSPMKQLQRLPPGTNRLNIANSAFERMESSSFENVSLTSIMINDNNQLKEIGPNTFANSPNIRTLNLYSNQISKISPTAFNGQQVPWIYLWNNKLIDFKFMKNLKPSKIDISSNQLKDLDFSSYPNMLLTSSLTMPGNPGVTEISRERLTNLDNLVSLDMGYCQVSAIDGDMFSHMTKLKYLNFDRNNLQTLPKSLLPVFKRVETVFVADNPYHCNCKMQWLKTEQIKVRVGPCATPSELAGKYFAELTENDLKCSPLQFIEVSGPEIKVRVGDAFQLVCVVSGDPAPDVQWISKHGEGELQRSKDIGGRKGSAILTIKSARAEHAGKYECKGKNEDESKSTFIDVLIE